MDIRTYFSSIPKPNNSKLELPTKKKSSSSSTNNKNIHKRLIESNLDEDTTTSNIREKKKRSEISSKRKVNSISDSSDESNDDKKRKKSKPKHEDKNNTKKPFRKRIISDSSTEEDISEQSKSIPQNKQECVSRKKLKPQSKLENLTVSSKFFKETSASEVFGDEPVKRTDKKLREIQEKLKHFVKPKNEVQMADDANFEAALEQLDEIGDNWVNWKEMKEIKKQPIKDNTKEKSVKNKKHLIKNTTELRSIMMDNSVVNKKILYDEKTDSLPESLSSGYCSADSLLYQNSDSQSVNVNRKIDNKDEAFTVNENITVTSVADEKMIISNVPITAKECINIKKNCEKLKQNIPKSTERISLPSECNIILTTDEYPWVEKYKPRSSKKIIGQQGDKSNVKKLTNWLNNWYKNNSVSKKASFVPNGWNKDPTGASFKAVLLSGPPGVGKTTSVSLVCQELGFDIVEFNASDTRSKKLLQEEVSELLGCTSLVPYFSTKNKNQLKVTKKHVLVMDEVDGMAGNEDRGGIQELIQLIKTTKIPIICMCNDRNHQKIRSLVNYCFDLRFSRPRVEQIKGFLKSVCFKEKLNISADVLTDIITSANNDIRLCLNHLSVLAADKTDMEPSKKYVKLNAWDVLRKVFSKEDHKRMSIHDKCDLFFYDYSIAPLFVQENYLTVKPLNPDAQSKNKKMELYARAADCISIGDTIDLQIRQNSAWSLLPSQAIFASYAPGEILEGYCTAQINFPSWLGKYSKQNKIDRLLQDLQIHTRFKISGSKDSVNLDYAQHLKNRVIEPLKQQGIEGVSIALEMLHQYDLLKEDLDSLIEVCLWPNSTNPMAALDSKVKAAFTRAYNKNPPMPPYSLSATIKKNRGNTIDEIPGVDNENESEPSDNEGDSMIVIKKKQPSKKLTSAILPSTSKSKRKENTENKKRRKK